MKNNLTEIIKNRDALLAYKTKQTKFLNRKFYIDQRVYVPNAETELMVTYAIQYIKKSKLFKGTFIDVGTGCGNIAISLAKEFPDAKIIATDISFEALEVAKINVAKHKVKNIHFLTDLVKDVEDEPDLIIGNLPWGDEDHLLQTNTKEALAQMPKIAVFAPDGIIGSYVRLCEQLTRKNWHTNLIIEVGILEKEIIIKNMPPRFSWEYVTLPSQIFNYSILKVNFKKRTSTPIVHHHLLYQGQVDRKDLNENSSVFLEEFLYNLVALIGMQILIHPKVAFSHQKAWTGIVGIVTSHIAFHYWTIENYLQLDIYCCKEFDVTKAISFLNEFWRTKDVNKLFIKRGVEDDFSIEKY